MNSNKKYCIFAGAISIIYFLILSFPIFKKMFSDGKRIKGEKMKEKEWVEEPMIIENE